MSNRDFSDFSGENYWGPIEDSNRQNLEFDSSIPVYSFHVVEKTYSGSHVRLSGLSSNFGTETILFDSRELPTTLMQLLANAKFGSGQVSKKQSEKKEDGFVTKMIGKRCDD